MALPGIITSIIPITKAPIIAPQRDMLNPGTINLVA